MGSDSEDSWKFAASMVLDQILERNENGNLYPLTSLEIQILMDIKGVINPEEEPDDNPEPLPQQPTGKQQGRTASKKKDGETYTALDTKDLT
jgi:hypothetical protein